MCRPKGYFLRPFGLKTSTNFAHVGLESGMVMGYGVWVWVGFSRKLREYEHICHFTSKKNKKKKGNYANSKCTVRNLFCWRYNLSNREVEHRVYGKRQT